MNFIRLQQDYDNPKSLASRFRRARLEEEKVAGLTKSLMAIRG